MRGSLFGLLGMLHVVTIVPVSSGMYADRLQTPMATAAVDDGRNCCGETKVHSASACFSGSLAVASSLCIPSPVQLSHTGFVASYTVPVKLSHTEFVASQGICSLAFALAT